MKNKKIEITKLFTKIVVFSVIVLCSSVLFGWVFDIGLLKRISPNLSAMNPLTAISFILLSISLFFASEGCNSKKTNLENYARAIFVLVGLISALRIVDILLGNSINLDFLIFRSKVDDATAAPARMAMATAVCFFFLSVPLLIISFRKRKLLIIEQLGILVSFIVSGLALFFYFWKGVIFLENPFYFSMALHTAMAFFALSLVSLVYLKNNCRMKFNLYNLKLVSGLLFLVIPFWYFIIVPEILTSSFELYSPLQISFVRWVIPAVVFIIALAIFLIELASNAQKRMLVYSFPFFVLTVSLAGTFFLWRNTKLDVNQQALSKFDIETKLMEDLVLERMEIYANALRAGRGFFLSSDEVTRTEWKDFVEGVNIQKNYPGVQGLGFAKVLKPEEINNFEESVRADGFPDFKVFPDYPRDVYTSIKYLEPFDFRNQRAFGYDMFSQETRRKAMEHARDNGTPSISGKVLLLQETDEDIQPGFLMYIPLYKKGAILENQEDREREIDGYIYSPFRMNDFVNAIFSNHKYPIRLEIFDGDKQGKDSIMYDSKIEVPTEEQMQDPKFEIVHSVDLYGNSWIFKFSLMPEYGLIDFQESYPALVLRLGIIFSFLLALLMYFLAFSRARAIKIAEEITEDLRVQTRDLEERKKMDEAILAGIGDGLTATDKNGDIIIANQAFTNILGWKKGEVLGKKMLEVIPMEEESGKKVSSQDRPLSRVLKTGKKIVDSEKYYRRRDGEKVPVEINVTPIISGGEVAGIIEIFRDISKEKEVDKMKTEFLSLASHQLRTPLSAIKWFLEIILGGEAGKLSKKQQEMLGKVDQSNNRMIELVNSLLNVSRLEQGRIMVDPEPIDLNNLLNEVLAETSFKVKEKKQNIIKKLKKNKLIIKIDPKLIRQVYLNLISNAIKYSPEKSDIIVSMKKTEKEVIFSVKDSGYGIPKSEQSKIFSKFYRASNISVKDTEGNGLGLYLVKKIVEVSGGRIWFESTENKGSTFSFLLPLSGSKKKKGIKSLT